ncbi:hypothetical protein TeGR_g376 [Tetraparma gracilis]|uniref:Uncharacterized protein n=1 Tax=Tetraparma gracilis TaxID=2962635 RepID=A0ABQ6MJI9_9STRA|nr:hypothetical protein TeGR_g376 [Tetraparma gracilis]
MTPLAPSQPPAALLTCARTGLPPLPWVGPKSGSAGCFKEIVRARMVELLSSSSSRLRGAGRGGGGGGRGAAGPGDGVVDSLGGVGLGGGAGGGGGGVVLATSAGGDSQGASQGASSGDKSWIDRQCRIHSALDEHGAAPFTAQRLSELLVDERTSALSRGHLCNAIEKLLAVTTTVPHAEPTATVPHVEPKEGWLAVGGLGLGAAGGAGGGVGAAGEGGLGGGCRGGAGGGAGGAVTVTPKQKRKRDGPERQGTPRVGGKRGGAARGGRAVAE